MLSDGGASDEIIEQIFSKYIAKCIDHSDIATLLVEAKKEIERLKDSNRVLWECVNSLSTQALMAVATKIVLCEECGFCQPVERSSL